MPALSIRPFSKPFKVKLAGLWTWNNAPARLVITAPLNKARLPAPVQRTVPSFSRVRVFSCTVPGLETLSVTPARMMIRPLPVMLPPVQFITLLTVTTPVPPNAPLLKSTTDGDTKPVPLKLAMLPEMVSVLVQM
jgi:hypothetical protein